MRHLAKRALSLLLALLLCITLFPAAALAEEGSIRPVEAGEDGVLDVPADAPSALPQEPTADEIQGVAASGSCGENLTWALDDAGVLTISGSGAMTDWNPQGAPWYSRRESIQTVRIEEDVTGIGSAAFYGCSRLTSVTIPESATSIGGGAFYGCSGLTGVTIPDAVTSIMPYAFRECGSLTGVTIPAGVSDIGEYAFQDCGSLKIVLFQGNAPYFFSNVFYNDQISAVYPIDNATWTANKLQNHGGTLTWVGYRDEAKAYTIHFDPNGGSDAPEDQIKGHNVDILLTEAVPGREYATFLGWSTRPDAAEPEYLPGESFDRNEDTTLYAVWEEALPEGIVAAGTCGENLTWTLDDTGVLTISGEGAMADWSNGSAPWYSQKESIQEARIDADVTTIGDFAFYCCSSLTRVSIPGSVTGIGSYAFFGCGSLTNVAIPEGVTYIEGAAFYGCSSLTSVTIPRSVTSIGYIAFANCSGLMTVTIPDSVTSIGHGAFAGCSNLLEFLVAEGNKAYASVDGVLYDLNVQTLIQCPGGKLGEFTIPESVTSIGDGAFNSCSSLTSVQIPEGVTSIGYSAFSGCSALTSVTIPASVTNIPQSPFRECSSLQEILVAKGNKDYASIAGVLYDASIQTLIQCPGGKTGEIAIPESVTSIGYCAFDGCSSLTSVTIPDGVISIGGGAFALCSSLRSVVFQGNAPMIEEGVFANDRTTALYPMDNPTWTSDKLQDYGAEKLTWVGYRDEAKAYTIHFDPNGGSDAPEDQIKGHNVDLLLTEAVPTREDASFLGWSTRRGAREPDYLPGSSFSPNADTTLYAVWKRNAQVLPTEAVLTLGSGRVCAGQEFTVDLTMEKNPGLMYLSFRLDYDTDSLEFLGAEEGVFTGWTVNTEKGVLVWDADGDRTENGVLLCLRFRAKEEARTGETAIALADLFAANYGEEILGIGTVPAAVTILPHFPGDVTGDSFVDGLDLIRLRKYLAGVPEAEIIETNANVNGDDEVDILDLIRLRKYLAQDDVILE